MSDTENPHSGQQSRSARGGWRGRRQSSSSASSRAWQQGGTVQPLTQLRLRAQRRRVRIAFLLLVVAVSLGFWLYGLLFRPVQTPFMVIVATGYEWPLPPNAWAQEDVDELHALHGRTVHLVETSADGRSAADILRELNLQMAALSARHRHSPGLIVYVSMHGAVDAQGEPCLIPPGALPYDTSTWLPVRSLLDCLKSQKSAERVPKLLVLDASRMESNWSVGLLSCSFANRLPIVARQVAVPQLAILNSAGVGQVAWASPSLQGSVFGHFLRQALTGAADADANRRLSLGELHNYLRTQVDRWATAHRAARQEPLLLAGEISLSRDLVWTPRRAVDFDTSATEEFPLDDVRSLWQSHDALLTMEPHRFSPLAFQDFERRLLWLEEASIAGRAYSARSQALRSELASWLGPLRARQAESSSPPSVAEMANVWAGVLTTHREGLNLHSLPLAAFWGTVDPPVLRGFRDRWDIFCNTPSVDTLGDILALTADGKQLGGQSSLIEHVFLQQMQRSGFAGDATLPADDARAFASLFAAVVSGEQAAVPDDERVLPWLGRPLQEADAARGLAEDSFRDGDVTAAAAATEQATAAYARCRELGISVAQAFALRDRAWAETPYLAQWLTAAPPQDEPSGRAVSECASRLKRLIENLHRLGDVLEYPVPAGTEAKPEVPRLITVQGDVERDLAWLRQRFDQHTDELLTARSSAASFRKIAAALATPLLPSDKRLALFESLLQLDDKLPGGATAPKTASSDQQDTAVPNVPPDVTAGLANSPQHPVVALLVPPWKRGSEPADQVRDAAAPGETSDLGTVTAEAQMQRQLTFAGAVVRQQLRELDDAIRQVFESGSPEIESAEGTADETRASRMRYSRSERLARAAAFAAPLLKSDPVADRQRADRQRLLLWHAERMVTEFRGPVAPGDEPFCSLAARDYLTAIQSDPATDTDIATRRDALMEKLTVLRQSASQYVSAIAKNVLLIDPSDPIETPVIVRPQPGTPALGQTRGRLALFVRSAERRVPGVVFAAPGSEARDTNPYLPFPLSEPGVRTLSAKALESLGAKLQLVAGFRGHEFSSPFLVETAKGISIDCVPTASDAARVVLKGIQRQRQSFVFILDCSESMQDLVPVEATDGRELPRLEVAKNALQSMLDQLSAERDVRVGVRFFGHRVGWSTTEPVRILRQTGYAHTIPLDLAPSEDVECVLPLGRFDSIAAGQIAELLKSLRPWGQTPLYRSVVEAIDDFDQDDADTEKNIVVITDGANYQFTPSASSPFVAPRPTVLDDVVRAWGKHKPALHIVGFGIPARELAAAETSYQELVARTKGTYETTAAEAQALLRKLDELLSSAPYTVVDEAGQTAGLPVEQRGTVRVETKPVRLGEPLVIRLPSEAGIREYTVACQTVREKIQLSGGESVTLLLTDGGRRMESASYLDGSPRFGRLFDAGLGAASGFQVGVHRPVAEDEGVRFCVSFQHENRQFTPRPAEVWIEVVPVLADGTSASPPYSFYDAIYEPDVPVPVVRWLAKNWPGQAPVARVRCWCKSQTTVPEVSLPLSELPSAPSARRRFEDFPGVEFQADLSDTTNELRVRVVEWHDSESAGVSSLRVALAAPPGSRAVPGRIARMFDHEHGVAAHVFVLPRTVPADLAGWQLQFTKASSLQAASRELQEPIEVTVTANQDLLPPLLAPSQVPSEAVPPAK